MVQHVRYNSLYISLLSSAKQQREMTKFCVVWRTWATTAHFLEFYFKFIAVSQIQFRDSLDSDEQSKWFKSISRFVGKIKIHFLIDVVVGVAVVAS